MNSRKLQTALAIVLLAALIIIPSVPAQADGIIIPEPPPGSQRGRPVPGAAQGEHGDAGGGTGLVGERRGDHELRDDRAPALDPLPDGIEQRARRAEGREDRSLDLVICDPPVFASAKDGGQFSLESEWPRLAARTAGLLGPDGAAVFANNHRTGDHAFYRRTLERHFAEVTDLRPPLDFPVFARRPHHVRTFWCGK